MPRNALRVIVMDSFITYFRLVLGMPRALGAVLWFSYCWPSYAVYWMVGIWNWSNISRYVECFNFLDNMMITELLIFFIIYHPYCVITLLYFQENLYHTFPIINRLNIDKVSAEGTNLSTLIFHYNNSGILTYC